MTLNIRTESTSPERITLFVEGRLDASNFGQFDSETQQKLAPLPEGGTVVLDLQDLEYISSAGLRSFAKIRKQMRTRNGHTLLLNPQPQVRKVFDIVKAVPVNEIFVTVQELDDYLDQIQRKMMQEDR
ncbi:STAS domain-containing protein [Oleiagrimonas citrea]|uniref:Anti-sigma factor antagonist n=1 Tax=Oleiagrimonas citrea TaxID=1665687 RepID=A0A846ZNZ6_9GAMM|nr:STAS domain-containing protein [Oleiagrimonas citrea]NKZ39746.1 STAS domain-containing protein [Oleiagrimonas citrea]